MKGPAYIYVTLSNGLRVELNAANGWSATISDLPAYQNGEPVVYTWSEPRVAGYRQTEVTIEGNLTTFTNRVIPVPETPQEHKPPKVPKAKLTEFDEYPTALGVEVMINHVGDCFD